MIDADNIADRLIAAKRDYYIASGYFGGALDCRIYIDRNSFNQFMRNTSGKVSPYTNEFYHYKTIMGYKVYLVVSEDPGEYIDIVVRKTS